MCKYACVCIYAYVCIYVCGAGLVAKSCLTLVIPWTVAQQAPLSIGFSRQEYWSRLTFLSPGDLPNTGIEPGSPALQADDLPYMYVCVCIYIGFSSGSAVKSLPAVQEPKEMQVRFLGWEGSHQSILAWRILWVEDLCRLRFIVSQRVRHN